MDFQQRFAQNWDTNAALYGSESWNRDPDFLYYIQGNIPLQAGQKLIEIREKFIADAEIKKGERVDVTDLHVTLALPGRLGTHFQKNDVSYMKKTLKNIFAQAQSIPITIQNLNAFPSVLWTEVYDQSSRLQSIHETICNEIPFSQHPEYRYQNYLPHVSLLFGGIGDITKSEREFEAIECEIDMITFGKAKDESGTTTRTVIEEYQLK